MANPTLYESLQRVDRLRELNKGNKQLEDLNDQELADLVYRSTRDARLAPAAQSSAIGRGIAKVGMVADTAGQAVEDFIGPEGSSSLRRIPALAAGNVVRSLPEFVGGVAMSRLKLGSPQQLAAMTGLAGFSYGRTKAETNDDTAALGSGASTVLGALMGGAGGKFARSQAAKAGAGTIGQTAAESAGAMIASFPADALEIGSAQGWDGIVDYFGDPEKAAAYVLSNAATDLGVSAASRVGDAAREKIQKVRDSSPRIDRLYSEPNEVDQLNKLLRTPTTERTAVDEYEIQRLKKTMAEKESGAVEQLIKRYRQEGQNFTTTPEIPATIGAQIEMLLTDKRPIVQVPKGTTLPRLRVDQTIFTEHEGSDGNTYLFDESKMNPDTIESAIVGNTVGELLGYGPLANQNAPTSHAAVLRSRRGLEKLAFGVNPEQFQLAVAQLKQYANPGDVIRLESNDQVLKWRMKNSDIKEFYSLKDGQEEFDFDAVQTSGDPAGELSKRIIKEVSFANTILRELESAFQPKIKGYKKIGPKFMTDAAGDVNGTGVLKAITKWASPDLMDYYKDRGIETLLTGDKVSKADIGRWLTENTPEVKVKELVPSGSVDEASKASHELETLGYSSPLFANRVTDLIGPSGERVRPEEVTTELLDLFRTAKKSSNVNSYSDAATGRYGVEPIRVDEMDRPSDILVRVPTQEIPGIAGTSSRRDPHTVLFSGPHFGDSDVNVLGFTRGYFVNDGDAWFSFEVQSDWGQELAKKEKIDEKKASGQPLTIDERWGYDTRKHPLLTNHTTLTLKTAIQHALKNGATKIVVPDPETAMMVEQHDTFTDTDTFGTGNVRMKAPKQEKGMRQHYGETVPNILKKLTGQKGRRVAVGQFTSRGPSQYFKNVDGSGKSEITGYEFDLNNLSPKVFDLFSMYDMKAQGDFEDSLRSAGDALRNDSSSGERTTPMRMLERAMGGDRSIELDAIAKFYNAIRGAGDSVTIRPMDAAGATNTSTREVSIDTETARNLETATYTLMHETAHVGLLDYKATNPEGYQTMIDQVNAIVVESRANFLDNIARQLGSDKFNVSYLSGALFDKNDPKTPERIAHEFVAGTVELMARAHFVGNKNPAWFKYLPDPIIKAVRFVYNKLRQYLGTGYPSLLHVSDPETTAKLKGLMEFIETNVISTEAAQYRARIKLEASTYLDPSRYSDHVMNYDEEWKKIVGNLNGGDDELHSWFGDTVKPALKKADNLYQKGMFTALFRTVTRPETWGHFNNLHSFRPNLQKDIHGYMVGLGRHFKGATSEEQAFAKTNEFISKLSDPTNKEFGKLRTTYGQIFEDITIARDKLMNPEDGSPGMREVSEDMLFTDESLKEKYKLDEDQIAGFRALLDLNKQVAARTAQLRSQTDEVIMTNSLYKTLKKTVNHEPLLQMVQKMTRLADDVGERAFNLTALKQHLDQLKADETLGPEDTADVSLQVNQMQMELDGFTAMLEQGFGQELAKLGEVSPTVALRYTRLMARLASVRAHERFIVKQEGYVPLTRRGRFFIKVYEDGLEGERGRLSLAKGFQTKAAMDEWLKANGPKHVDVIDKEDLRGRARLYTSSSIDDLREKARTQLDQSMQELLSDGEMTPDDKAAFADMFEKLRDTYRPLEQEYKDVISVRGDKFKERRYLVPGFEQKDFIPNIFEYMNYKTVAAQKTLTRAMAQMQVDRKEFDNDLELRERMKLETDYALNHVDEFNKFRELGFLTYLGSSIRHVVQNSVQIPLTGVSQLVADGASIHTAYAHIAKGATMAAKWAAKGSTGDPVIDSMLKQAEFDSKLGTSAIDLMDVDTSELQRSIDSMEKVHLGEADLGTRVSHANSQFWGGVKKFMMGTSIAAERANRVTTLIAGVLHKRAQGVKSLDDQYTSASRLVDFVNFTGDKSNRPGFLIANHNSPKLVHGALLTWNMLQSFTHNHISQLYAMYKKGNQGSVQHKKAFYTGMAHLIALSGGMGFIGAATGEALFEELTGISLKKAVREGLVTTLGGDAGDVVADLALYGLPGLANIDASSGIGLGSPLIRYQANQPMMLENVAGAGYGLLVRAGQALGALKKDPLNPDQLSEAIRTVAPASVSNTLRLFDVINRGTVLDRNRQPVGDPLGVGGSVGSALGFTPMSVSKEREFKNLERRKLEKLTEQYRRSASGIAEKVRLFENTNDPEYLARARKQFNDYMQDMPMQNRQSFVSSIVTQLQQARGKVTEPASLKTSETRQDLERAYPSVKARYGSRLDALLDELKVAQFLGQGDLIGQRLRSLPASVLDRVLSDQLVQGGVRPENVQPLLKPQTLDPQQLEMLLGGLSQGTP